MLPGITLHLLQKLQDTTTEQLLAEGTGRPAADLVWVQGASAGVLQGLAERRRVSQLRQALQFPKQPMQLLKCNLQLTIELLSEQCCWQHSMSSQGESMWCKAASMRLIEQWMVRNMLRGTHLSQAIEALGSLAQYCTNRSLSQT